MTTYRIAVMGGTGPQGKGLAFRFAQHGHTVVLGSRAAEKAVAAAEEVNGRLTGPAAVEVDRRRQRRRLRRCRRGPARGAVRRHDELVAALPLAGKTVVSCVNPLAFDKRGAHGRVIDGGEGSAAESAQRIAPDAVVVGAFHHVSAVTLWSDAEYLDEEDILVCGDTAEGKQVAIELARCVTGRDGIDGGKLRLARQLEPLTAVLISINRKYKVHSGIRISGLG